MTVLDAKIFPVLDRMIMIVKSGLIILILIRTIMKFFMIIIVHSKGAAEFRDTYIFLFIEK